MWYTEKREKIYIGKVETKWQGKDNEKLSLKIGREVSKEKEKR